MIQQIFNDYSKKWKLTPEQVETIYLMISDLGGKYGKSHRRLLHFNIKISTRQLKYFYRKIRLTERYGTAQEIGKSNYSKLVTKRS